MSVLFRYIVFIFAFGISFSVFAQNEYEDDLEFKTPQSSSFKKIGEKRNVNIHFHLGYNLSTVTGQDVKFIKNALDSIAKIVPYDSYSITPSYWPTGGMDLSINFNPNLSFSFGVHYNVIGWKEVARYKSSSIFFRGESFYKFHKLNIPISLQLHPIPALSLYFGASVALPIKSDYVEKVIFVSNGDTIDNIKNVESFEQATGVEPKILAPQLFFGSHFGFDRFRFNINFTFTPNFIRNDISIHNISLQAGLIFKLFKDYEREF